jgi:threonine aldolase
MVYFDVTAMSAPAFAEAWLAAGVAALPMNDRTIRAVTHLDVSREDIERALSAARSVVSR